jgi:hypothetical protein
LAYAQGAHGLGALIRSEAPVGEHAFDLKLNARVDEIVSRLRSRMEERIEERFSYVALARRSPTDARYRVGGYRSRSRSLSRSRPRSRLSTSWRR